MTYYKNATKQILSIFLLSSLAACVASPEYFEYQQDEIIVETGDVEIETATATKTDAETELTAEQEQIQFLEEEKTYERFSTASGYWKNAIKHLQHGNEDEAKWALNQALKLDPNNKVANKLIYQIDADAINELGIINFEYEVQYGDSLSKIAKTYLNDPLQFYLLAKYNNIINPSHLVIGRVINIPGMKPVEVSPSQLISEEITISKSSISSEENRSVENSNSVHESDALKDIRLSFNNKEYNRVVGLLEDSAAISEQNVEAIKLLVNSYHELAKTQLLEGNAHEAKYLLLKAAEIEPDNPKINMALIDMDESLEVENIYEEGLTALAENRIVEAFEHMNHVIELNPNHKRALEKREEIKVKLIPHYYRSALMAQRKHQLDEAIEMWDEVLVLDPNNENAKIYRSKAVNLKMKLDKFAAK